MKRGTKKRLVWITVFLGILGSAALVYMVRPPVVIVVDEAFLSIYGRRRANIKRYVLSAPLLRRVVFAVVAGDAGQGAANFAVNTASKTPCLALFPEWYLGDAEQYAAAIDAAGLSGKTRTVVVDGGASGGKSIGRAESLPIDRETDLYRAGMCAAILAKGGGIVVCYQGNLPAAQREAFIEGLTVSGYTKAPIFLRNTESMTQTDIGCVVLLSVVNTNLLAVKDDIPTILFSWLDPEYTPSEVTVIFDDSLPAVVGQVMQGRVKLAAQTRILKKRLESAASHEALKAAVNAKRK
jgi:hypothetical protein